MVVISRKHLAKRTRSHSQSNFQSPSPATAAAKAAAAAVTTVAMAHGRRAQRSLTALAWLARWLAMPFELTQKSPRLTGRLARLAWLAGWLAAGLLAPLVKANVVPLEPTQVQFLNDSQAAWRYVKFPGLEDPKPDCVPLAALDITCNAHGMIDHLLLGNQILGGPIPQSISNLRNLTWLGLSSSQLSGSIPAGIGDLIHMVYISATIALPLHPLLPRTFCPVMPLLPP
ncbi:unnamed protein product, partial [Closterium sp. Naga37s-1]